MLLGEPAGKDPVFAQFEAGLACFRRRAWEEAKELFASCMADRPQDGPSRYYLNLIDAMIANPPPPDWEGVSVMEQK